MDEISFNSPLARTSRQQQTTQEIVEEELTNVHDVDNGARKTVGHFWRLHNETLFAQFAKLRGLEQVWIHWIAVESVERKNVP